MYDEDIIIVKKAVLCV